MLRADHRGIRSLRISEPTTPTFARIPPDLFGDADRPESATNLHPVEIVADTKDWTWVLERQCPECGLDTTAVSARDVGTMLRASSALWQRELNRANVGTRPDPATWSVLEYGCHVRDVCRRFDERLGLMLSQDDPVFENWDQDATAIEQRYGNQRPAAVADELAEAAERLSRHVDEVTGDQWQRTGRRDDGARFTVESFARYLIHDVVHHQHDIGARVSGTPPVS